MSQRIMESLFPLMMFALAAGSAFALLREWRRPVVVATRNVLPPELCSTPEARRAALVPQPSKPRPAPKPHKRMSVTEIGDEIVAAIEHSRSAESDRYSVALPIAIPWEDLESPQPPIDEDAVTDVDHRVYDRMYWPVAR